MRSLLRDPALQQQLETDGYTVMPYLEKEALLKLRAFYHEIHPEGQIPTWIDGIHMTSWCSDLNYKLKVRDTCLAVTQDFSKSHFDNCRFLNQVFIIKQPGKNTTFKVHQDWNVVDESKHSSVNIWTPLWDVNSTNGALWIVPGSHRIDRPVRGAGYLFPDYSAHLPFLQKKARSITLKAGDAVIFYHNVIHGSPPNLGDDHRVALAFSAVPREAPLCIYFQKEPGDPLQQHEPPDDFMYYYQHLRSETMVRPPTVQPVAVHPTYRNLPVTTDELSEISIKAKHKKFWQFLLPMKPLKSYY
jgi:hypothetical protein